MKKHIALFLVLIMVLVVAACGKENDSSDKNETKPTDGVEVVTPTEEMSTTPTLVLPTEEPSPSPTPTEEPTPSPTPTEEPTPSPTQAVNLTTGYENGKVTIVLTTGRIVTCDIAGEWRVDDGRVFGVHEESEYLGLINESVSFDFESETGVWDMWGSVFFMCSENDPSDPDYVSIDEWIDNNYKEKGEYKGWITMNQGSDYPNYCAIKAVNNVEVFITSRVGTYEALKFVIDSISNLNAE